MCGAKPRMRRIVHRSKHDATSLASGRTVSNHTADNDGHLRRGPAAVGIGHRDALGCASSFSMSDTGGTTFTGTVQNSGQFTATATFGPDANGQTFSQQLQGNFTTNGFTAMLSVHASPRNCDFTRNWTASKQGSPNVIPG
jgi:hypothetical protein